GQGAVLDAGRAVADDVVEALLQLLHDALDPLALQGVLVAGLRGRKDVEVLDPLVADQRLVERRLAVDDVDEVEDDAALAAHHQIEVAQADIEVDHDRLLAAQREAGADRRRGRRLADAALARGDHDYMCQTILLIPLRPYRFSTMTSRSSSSMICTG